MTNRLLVLYAHGSRDPRWRGYFEELLVEARTNLGADNVEVAYMEFCSPTLDEIAAAAYADGTDEILLLPLFLAGGAHVARDIPEQVARVRRRFPSLQVDVLPPIGENPLVVKLFHDVIKSIWLEALTSDGSMLLGLASTSSKAN